MPRSLERPPALLPDEGPPVAGQTARSIVLGERTIAYILRRARRRTIGLVIDHRGLRVGAPPRAPLAEIEALIRQHGPWVLKKIDEWTNHQCDRRREPLLIVDGVRLPLLGRVLQVRCAHGNNRTVWNEQAAPILTLCLRTPAAAPRLLEKAMRERARELFAGRLEHYARQLGLRAPPPLALSSARTRWGSCSRKSGIRLNWRLIHFPPHVIDYVVAHELAHLREMNHSPRFWAVVGQLFPDYQRARQELKELGAACPVW
ncbi:MAG: SprT family zinc-dependent metalloprotease [Propionivibrio sp.]